MIEQKILHRIRNGVCAVGYLTVPLPDYETYYRLPAKFVVMGTGFLVRDTTAITCRHVIDDLMAEAKREQIPASQLFVSFVVPRTDGTLGITVRLIRHHDSSRGKDVDIGFISFEIVHPKHFRDIVPPDIVAAATVHVSEEIAAYGYPHGSALLEKDDRVQRWGPVLQQGWISGVAPHDAAATPDELLLDLRAAQGMSGAPVFRPNDGLVIGMVNSGKEAIGDQTLTTTVFAQPINQRLLGTWLAEYDLRRNGV
jgi:V8-like Glu-specific endopeptidase